MANEDHAETATPGTSNEQNPLHLKMLDALIDQAHVSAHITLSGIKGMQDMYMCGVRMMAETGKAIEDGCRIKIPLRGEAAGFVERTTSVFLRVQSSILKVSIHSTLHAAELLRYKLAENIPGRKEEGHAKRKKSATDTRPVTGQPPLNDPFKSTWPDGGNIVSVRDVAEGHRTEVSPRDRISGNGK